MAGTIPVYQHDEEGLQSIALGPGFDGKRKDLGLPLLLAAARHPGRRPGDADRQRGRRPLDRHAGGLRALQGADPAVPVPARPAPRSTCGTEQRGPRRAGRPGHLLPRRRGHRLRRPGQPLPVDRRRHQPVPVRRLHADRRAGRPQPGLRRPAQLRQHQRPARQDPARQGRRERGLHDPGGQPLPARQRSTRPEIYAMGLAQPVPDRARTGPPASCTSPTTRRTRTPPTRSAARRATASGRRRQAGQLRLALLRDRRAPLQRLRLRHRDVGPKFNCAAPGQRLAAQHRPARAAPVSSSRSLVLLRRLRGVPGARHRRHRPDGRTRRTIRHA